MRDPIDIGGQYNKSKATIIRFIYLYNRFQSVTSVQKVALVYHKFDVGNPLLGYFMSLSTILKLEDGHASKREPTTAPNRTISSLAVSRKCSGCCQKTVFYIIGQFTSSTLFRMETVGTDCRVASPKYRYCE